MKNRINKNIITSHESDNWNITVLYNTVMSDMLWDYLHDIMMKINHRMKI